MSPWSPLHPLHLFLGLIIWSAWFVFLYGGLSVACEFAPPGVEQGALPQRHTLFPRWRHLAWCCPE